MPFSPDEYKIELTDADILRKARALIDAPEKWTQGQHAVNGALCLEGAILIAGRGEIGDGLDGLLSDGAESAFALFCEATGLSAPCRWNDAPERTHAEVLAAFDRAIALAETRAP